MKGPDLSSARVIANLRLTSPFDTWDLKLWSKELTTEVKGKEVTATYKRPYLLSPEGHVITTQLKAWNDAVGESLTSWAVGWLQAPLPWTTCLRRRTMHMCAPVFATLPYHVIAGTVMYAEVVLAPWVARLRERGGLLPEQRPVYVWDNFSAHHVKVVSDAFLAAGVDILCLLANTTDILQVMDLVVNGPGKAFLRSARIRYARSSWSASLHLAVLSVLLP